VEKSSNVKAVDQEEEKRNLVYQVKQPKKMAKSRQKQIYMNIFDDLAKKKNIPDSPNYHSKIQKKGDININQDINLEFENQGEVDWDNINKQHLKQINKKDKLTSTKIISFVLALDIVLKSDFN